MIPLKRFAIVNTVINTRIKNHEDFLIFTAFTYSLDDIRVEKLQEMFDIGRVEGDHAWAGLG